MVSLGDNAGEYSLHVYEAKGVDSPTLGSRNSAESGRVQQGSPGYLADLTTGRNIDPRVRKIVNDWLADPGSAGLVAQLRGQGILVTYEMVNARTSGNVVVSQFDLGGVFRLKLVGDELVIARG